MGTTGNSKALKNLIVVTITHNLKQSKDYFFTTPFSSIIKYEIHDCKNFIFV